MSKAANKVVAEKQVARLAAMLRRKRKKIVTTNGCFDLLHVGQMRSLQAAKKHGDILIVGVNTDASIRRIKGGDRPILPLDERMEMLAALECVDFVSAFTKDDPLQWLALIKPHIHVKGSDRDPKTLKEHGLLESWGGELKIVPYTQKGKRKRSTTDIIAKIRSVK